MLDPFLCINLDIVLVIMHYALCIIHYAGFGTHYKLSKFWVASASLWVEPLISIKTQFQAVPRSHCRHPEVLEACVGCHQPS